MKVSIVIPVYNVDKYIGKCLESIINQTYKDIEIIVVDDGSTDSSLSIIKEYQKKDQRIIVITQKNAGGVLARKTGILKASGEYILVFDSDDWVELDTVERLVNYAKEYKNIDIIKFNSIEEPKKKIRSVMNIGDKHLFEGDELKELINILVYSNNWNNIWNAFIKKDLFDFNSFVYEKIVHKAEDLQLNLQILPKAKKVLVVNDVLYHYYINPTGITQKIYPQKVINNLNDILYLSNVKKMILKENKLDIDHEMLKKKVLISFLNHMERLVKFYDYSNDDLKYIYESLDKSGLYSYVEDVNTDNLKINLIKRIILKIFLKKKSYNLKKYKYIFKIYGKKAKKNEK